MWLSVALSNSSSPLFIHLEEAMKEVQIREQVQLPITFNGLILKLGLSPHIINILMDPALQTVIFHSPLTL